MNKSQLFDRYLSETGNWSHEAYMPITLQAIFKYVVRNDVGEIPIDYIVDEFRQFYVNRKKQGKRPLDRFARQESEERIFIFNNIETVEQSRLKRYVIRHPISTLVGKNQRRGEEPYEFIQLSGDKIVIHKDIVDAFPEKLDKWVNIVEKALKEHFYNLECEFKSAE